MKIVKFNEAETYEPEKDWKRVSICSEDKISIEYFVKPPKHSSPKHAHPNVQVLVVLKGQLEVWSEKDGTKLLNEMDTVYFEENEEHIVTNPLDNDTSVGLDIFLPGRSFDFWLKRKSLLK
jgi:quercetin dioxygenase-like cupin family protein